MIRAEGLKRGQKLTVEFENNSFLFDGLQNDVYETELLFYLEKHYPMGGTYVPADTMEPLNIINVLRNHFFDKLTSFETDLQVELPHDEGGVY